MAKQYNVEQISIIHKERWNNLLYSSLYPSYRQSLSFEYSKESKGRKVSSFIFNLNGEDVAGVHYSIKRSKFNLLSTADILSGIVFKIEPTVELLNYIINHFIGFAKSNKVAYVRITPWLPKLIADENTHYELLFNQVLLNKGFDITHKGRHTYWIDLSKSEDELFKNVKSQTKRKIKKVINSNMELETYDEFIHDKVSIFYSLYNKLGNNKDFEVLSQTEFFQHVKSLLDEGATLFLLKFNNTVVDVALSSNKGIATYYHGALNFDYKELEGCPAPGHYMQWAMIRHMKNKGLKTYDMAFCPGPVPQQDHPNYGIWRFKYEFGGNHVEFLPTYGKIIKPLIGKLFKFLRDKK